MDSVDEPEHERPPLAGAGLSHRLLLVCVPLAHVTEQDPQDNHWPQFPSTEKKIFARHYKDRTKLLHNTVQSEHCYVRMFKLKENNHLKKKRTPLK